MPRAVLPLLILGTIVVAALLAWFTLNRGSSSSQGETTTETRALDPFNRLEVTGMADLVLIQDGKEEITVEAPVRGITVRAVVNDGTLSVSSRDARRWWNSLLGRGSVRSPRVTLHVTNVESIVLSGAVRLSADRLDVPQLRIAAPGASRVRIDDLQARSLRFSGSGAIEAELGGRVAEQHIAISGAGKYRAGKLASDDVTVAVSGVGSVLVRAEKTLNAAISGAGNVEYYGNPTVKERISGIGKVRRREAIAPSGALVALAGAPYTTRAQDADAPGVEALQHCAPAPGATQIAARCSAPRSARPPAAVSHAAVPRLTIPGIGAPHVAMPHVDRVPVIA